MSDHNRDWTPRDSASDVTMLNNESDPEKRSGGEPAQTSSMASPQQPKQSQSPPEQDERILVRFDEGDPVNPKNWSVWRKIFITFLLGMLALSASLGSSIISPATDTIAAEFRMSQEVSILSISLYM